MSYLTPQDAKDYTGARPEWFDLPDEAALDSLLQRWIEHAVELVDRYIGAHYDPNAAEDDPNADPPVIAAPPPKGVVNGALRVVANMVAQARVRRKTAILQLDEFTQRLVEDDIFTSSIKSDLALYQRQEPKLGGRRAASGAIETTGLLGDDSLVYRYTGNWEKDLAGQKPSEAAVIRYWYAPTGPDGERRV